MGELAATQGANAAREMHGVVNPVLQKIIRTHHESKTVKTGVVSTFVAVRCPCVDPCLRPLDWLQFGGCVSFPNRKSIGRNSLLEKVEFSVGTSRRQDMQSCDRNTPITISNISSENPRRCSHYC